MPTFRTQRPGSIASSVRALFSAAPEMTAADQMAIDQAVATTRHRESLAERVRQEVEEQRAAAAARNDPMERARYAGITSGMNVPDAEALYNFIAGNPDAVRPEHITPEMERAFRATLGSTLATRQATAKTNAQQMTAGGGNLLTQAIRNEMTAPDVELGRENQLGHAIGVRAREPYRISREGVVLNEETGGVNEGTDLARTVRANIDAQAGERRAHAGLHSTRAGDIVATQPGRIDLNAARAGAARRGPQARPAPNRTPAQEARDQAYADKARAAADAANRDLERREQSAAKSQFARDPEMKGNTLGRWITGQGFEVKRGGKVVGYYTAD